MLGFGEVVGYVAHEWHCALGNSHIAFENCFESLRTAVVDFGVVAVLRNASPVEADAGEEAFVARVGKEFGVHLPIRGCLVLRDQPDRPRQMRRRQS